MMDDDQLSALYGAALTQQAMAKAAIEEMARERAKLSDTIQTLKNAAGGVQIAAGDAARKGVTETLAQSVGTAKAAVNASAEALDDATDRIRDAAAWVGWKLALVLCIAGASAVAVNYAIGRFTLPTRGEIEALQVQKAELEANIADLEKRGGRIKLARCGPQPERLCVRVAHNQGGGRSDFRGAWESPDGKERYAIPYGY